MQHEEIHDASRRICIRNARETYARNLKMTTIRSKDQISNIKMLRDIWEFCTTSHVSAQYIVIDFPKISRSRIIKHTSETQRIQYKTTFSLFHRNIASFNSYRISKIRIKTGIQLFP